MDRVSRRVLLGGSAMAGAALLLGCRPTTVAPVDVVPTQAPPPAATPTVPPVASPPAAPISLVPTTPTPLPRASPEVTSVPASGPAPLRLVGYLAGWTIGKGYRVADVPADRLTHLNYAFAGVSADGECVPTNERADLVNFAELRRLKQQWPRLRTAISIGGAGGPGYFPVAARTAESRRRFARSCARFARQHGFDGVDVDWEFPSVEDKTSFTQLLAALRSELDAQGAADGTRYDLTIAAPAGPNHYWNLELGQIHRYLDWLNLMTYAFHGPWSPVTNFDAPLYASSTDPGTTIQRLLYNADAAVQVYLAAGTPPEKIVLGVPFYGYGWKGVPDVNHGLYQTVDGLPEGTRARGVFAYRDLKDRFLGIYPRYWHDEAQVPWLYDPTAGVMITYDDPQSLGVKAAYARSHHLGGVMIWELSSDDAEHSLVTAIVERLAPAAVLTGGQSRR